MSRNRFDPLERVPQFGEYYRGALRRQNRNLLLQQQQQHHHQQQQQPEFPSDVSELSGDHYDVTYQQPQHQQRHQHSLPSQQQMQQELQSQLPPPMQPQLRQQLQPQMQHQLQHQLQPQLQQQQQQYHSDIRQKYPVPRRAESSHRRHMGPLTFDNLAPDAYDSSFDEGGAGGDNDGLSSLGSREDRKSGRSSRWRQTDQRTETIFSSPQVEVLLQVNSYECSRCGRRCSRVSLPSAQSPQHRQQHHSVGHMPELSPLSPLEPALASRRHRQQRPPPMAGVMSDASSGRQWKGPVSDRRSRYCSRRY